MLFSQTVEYALRAAVWLADHVDQAQTTQQIAAATRVPAGYLSKVMQSLGRAGIVQAQRGVGGGFLLSRPPEQITALEVVNAIDPLRRIDECPLGIESHGSHLCPLHRKVDEATALIEKAFGETSLADFLRPTPGSRPLCAENPHTLTIRGTT